MATFKYINKLRNKRILIFGATSGFGFAVAEASLEHGANVILSGSSQPRLDSTVKRLKTSYPDLQDDQITTAVCDLSDVDTLSDRYDDMLNTLTNAGTSKIDHVVFTADDSHPAPPITSTTPNDIFLTLRLRVYATTLLAKSLSSGKYVNLSADSTLTFTNGVAGNKPVPGLTVPSMAATALEGLVRGLAVDMAPLRVNLVSAGFVKTELMARIPEKALEVYESKTLTKRMGRPEDIAETYLYLMKDGLVTGSILFSDGGLRLA